MRRVLRFIAGFLIVIVLFMGAIALWKREEVGRLIAVNSLFAPEKIVSNFSHMDELFLSTPVPRGDGPVTPLPKGPDLALPEGAQDWLESRRITALVVLKDGHLVHETYRLGTGPDDLRISWSVAKSYLSALIGILLDEGAIASLDEPVTRYAPALEGSAYEGATIRNVLQMASGVDFDEEYADFWSDINKMGRVIALGGSMDDFAAEQEETFAPPGETWKYVSIDTHVLGMVARGATGRSLADLMSEKVIGPMGLEADPYFLTDGYGVAFALGGLNLTTRDYARMGQVFLQDGRLDGRRIVPADWVRASTTPSAPTDPGKTRYGYQWWMAADAPEGEFFAQGLYGQYVYVNRPLGVVIACNAADPNFRGRATLDANIEMFRRIAQSADGGLHAEERP